MRQAAIMFYASSTFDPTLISLQIVCVQTAYYLTLGIFLALLDAWAAQSLSLDQMFKYTALTFDTTLGWATAIAFAFNALVGALILGFIVGRARKCLDFGTTVHFLHLIFSGLYAGWPMSWTWWVVQISCAVVMILLGEYFCMQREMREIPVSQLGLSA